MATKVWTWVMGGANTNLNLFFAPTNPIPNGYPGDPTHTYIWEPWPTTVPTQLNIVRCRIGHQTPSGLTTFGQLAITADSGRVSFNTGGQTGQNGQLITLGSLWTGPSLCEPQERTERWDEPVAFNANTDLLWLTQDGGPDQWFFQIGYLA